MLLRYSANGGVNGFILRRRDRKHLRNELNRLAHIPNLRPLPGREEPKSNENEPKSNEDSPKEGTTADDEDDTVTYLDLNRHEREDPDKLPPTLKELWLKNRDEYKELQYCHAQMKQANSDAGRADWRRQVFEHRESIQKRWQLFDEEKARLAADAGQTETEDAAYNPNNDRAYISKALKKDDWDDALKLEVQHRVDALLKHNIPVSDETIQRLKERGISI